MGSRRGEASPAQLRNLEGARRASAVARVGKRIARLERELDDARRQLAVDEASLAAWREQNGATSGD